MNAIGHQVRQTLRPPSPIEKTLTESRQLEMGAKIMRLYGQGLTYIEIEERLGFKESSIKAYAARYRKAMGISKPRRNRNGK